MYDYILSNQNKLTETWVRNLALKLGQALDHLHQSGIILRDFDADGIVMNEQTHDILSINPRITRINHAIVMDYSARTSGINGDIRFKAPEVVCGKPYDFKAEAWSYGVLLFFMLVGELPFDDPNYKSAYSPKNSDQLTDVTNLEKKIIDEEPPLGILKERGISAECIDLVNKLLNKNETTRLNMQTAIKHPWFKINFDKQMKSTGRELLNDLSGSIKKQMSTAKKEPDTLKIEQQASRGLAKRKSTNLLPPNGSHRN